MRHMLNSFYCTTSSPIKETQYNMHPALNTSPLMMVVALNCLVIIPKILPTMTTVTAPRQSGQY